MEEHVNVLFSILSGAFTQAEMDGLRATECSWVHLNTRLGRFFIDIIGPMRQLQAIKDKLLALGRDPIVLGVFDYDGNLLNSANKTEWAKVARDVKTYDANGTLVSSTRPVAYVDVHRWAGWGEKIIP